MACTLLTGPAGSIARSLGCAEWLGHFCMCFETVPGEFDWSNAAVGECDSDFQSVPRAELTAIVEVVRQIVRGAPLRIGCDHKNHVKAFTKGKSHTLGLKNADLWWEFWAYVEERTAGLELVHIPSHVCDH